MSINCDRHDLPSDRCGYCKDEENEQLRNENKMLTEELNEQARLLGISAEKELALLAKVERLEMERDRLLKGEHVCKRCGLRKDNEHLTPDF